jgi:hypothetical protein
MCLGEKKELVIPPELGYGERGAGKDIPPNATLRFEIDIVGINDQVLKVESAPNVFKEMDADNDGKISYEEMAAWFATKHPDKLDRIPAGLFEREDKNAVSSHDAPFFAVAPVTHSSVALGRVHLVGGVRGPQGARRALRAVELWGPDFASGVNLSSHCLLRSVAAEHWLSIQPKTEICTSK